MKKNPISNAAPPLTPAVFHILLSLADGEKHGYAIMKEVEAQTEGKMKMGPGTLYGSIKRMLAAGLIRETGERLELLQGTLDLLILRTLIFGPQHGQGIARSIQQTSEEELLVEHGALYPALQRLEERGWISAKWGISSNNRKARFYSLTAAGRKQLVAETTKWKRLARAIARILEPEASER